MFSVIKNIGSATISILRLNSRNNIFLCVNIWKIFMNKINF